MGSVFVGPFHPDFQQFLISGASSPSLADTCDHWVGQCFQYDLPSEHFVVIYNATGRFAVTHEWAQNVSLMAEAAHDKLVVEEGFTAPARNPIPIYLDNKHGGFTNFLLCSVCTATLADLQHLQIEYRFKSPCPRDCGIPTSNWEVAHEVFHTIQFTQFGGWLPFGNWLAEGSANWAGYTVAGNESRWDPWVVSAWMGPNGTTEKALEERSYDDSFFLVFLSDHYGGPEIIKRIISNADRETNASAVVVGQLHALGYDKTFAKVMNEFASALLTGNFTDRDGAGFVLRQLPPIAATAEWTGTNQSVSAFTSAVNGFAAGDRLQVETPGGTEFVRVRPASDAALSIEVLAPNSACFEATVIARSGNDFTTYGLQSGTGALASPNIYDDIFVAITKGNCSSGEFSVFLSNVQVQGLGLLTLSPELLVFAAVLAILVALVVTAIFLQRGRKPQPAPKNLRVNLASDI